MARPQVPGRRHRSGDETIAEAARVAHRESGGVADDAENAARVFTSLASVSWTRMRPRQALSSSRMGKTRNTIASVVDFLSARGIEAIVLKRVSAAAVAVPEVCDFALEARFALVLIGNDESGAARRSTRPMCRRPPRLYCARQNLNLEVGFFYGLSWGTRPTLSPGSRSAISQLRGCHRTGLGRLRCLRRVGRVGAMSWAQGFRMPASPPPQHAAISPSQRR